MLGAGGMAANWIRRFFPPHADRAAIVALVDRNEGALARGGDFLGLPSSRRFRTMADAFASVEADFCVISLPPSAHQEAVTRALERKLPILSEKPIADTWDACCAIYAAVRQAGVKMQVVQNYRYYSPMLTLRRVLREGDLGRINYIVARFAKDYRVYGSWGAKFRHEIPHGLLIEGAVHHFDMLRNLSGGDCHRLAGWEWNPAWSSSKGEFCNLYALQMTNGVRASYEGSGTAAGTQNIWHDEYYRVECEDGSVVLDRDHVVRVHRFGGGHGLRTEEIVPQDVPYQEHVAVIDQFLTWLDDGAAPEATLEDNIKSVAMVFAAIEASRTNQVVDVAAMVDRVRTQTS